jgi:hypothetical protein
MIPPFDAVPVCDAVPDDALDDAALSSNKKVGVNAYWKGGKVRSVHLRPRQVGSTHLRIDTRRTVLRFSVSASCRQALCAARDGHSVVRGQILELGKYHSRSRRNTAYPCLGARTDTRVNQGRSTSGGIGLGVEAEIGTEELDALVVALLNDPLLTSRRLLVVSRVASCQGHRGTSVRVGHL